MTAEDLKDTELNDIKALGSTNTGKSAQLDEDEDEKSFKSP